MFSSSSTRFRALVGLSAFALFGCQGSPNTPTLVTKPTLDNIDEQTNDSQYVIKGTRSPHNAVWVQYKSQSSALELAPSTDSTNWQGVLELLEGVNRFVLFSSNEYGKDFSATTQEYKIVLDTIAPDCPTIDEFPDSINLENETTKRLLLSGTKARDGNIIINSEVVVGHDGQTTWQKEVAIQAGLQSFKLTTKDELGNSPAQGQCSPNELQITGVNIAPPAFSQATPNRTANASLSLEGTKPSGTQIYISHTSENTNAVLIESLLGNQTWRYDQLLLQEGDNIIQLYAKLPNLDATSAVVTITINLDTQPPLPPVLAAIPSITDKTSVVVNGTKSLDSFACYTANLLTSCEGFTDEISATNSFSFEVPLQTGTNTLSFFTTDDLGNPSTPVVHEIHQLSPPQITIMRPLSGEITIQESLHATLEISHPPLLEAAIEEVLLCANTDCIPVNPTEDNNTYSAILSLENIPRGDTFDFSYFVTNTAGLSYTHTIPVLYHYDLIGVTAKEASIKSPALTAGPNGTIHATWAVECPSGNCIDLEPGTISGILYRPFDPLTNGWGQAALVSGTTGGHTPTIAHDNDNRVNIFWIAQAPTDLAPNIYFRAIAADGTLHPIERLTNNTLPASELSSTVAADGSIHLVWRQESTEGISDIFYSRGLHNAFEEPTVFRRDLISLGQPHIDTDSSSRPHIVFRGHGDLNVPGAKLGGTIFYVGHSGSEFFNEWEIVNAHPNLCHADNCTPVASDPYVFVGANEIVSIAWADNAPRASLLTCPASSAETPASSDMDIYMRRYTTTMAPIVPQANNNLKYQAPDTCASSSDSSHPVIAPFGNGNLLVAWLETKNDGLLSIRHSVQINENNGALEFSSTNALLAQQTDSHSLRILTKAPDQFHFFWLEKRVAESFPLLEFVQDNGDGVTGEAHLIHHTTLK